MERVRRIILGWCAAWLLTSAAIAEEAKLQVVTSFFPAWSLATSIAGEHAEVRNLLPGGVSLHDYQLSPRDLRQLSGADVVVVNGLGMEGFLERALQNLGQGMESKVVAMSDGLDDELLHEEEAGHEGHDHDHGPVNPHIWLDPTLAAHAATNILNALQKADPAHAAAYASNATDLVQRLHALDQEIAGKLKDVAKQAFITYHNAFPYFVRRYGLNLAGVVEEVPEVTPSPREMTRLLRTIREKQVKALFTEPQERSRLAERIASDAGIRTAELDPLETGELKAGAYEEAMRRNVESLLRALNP